MQILKLTLIHSLLIFRRLLAAVSSFIWSLFKINDSSDPSAQCVVCNERIRRGTGERKSFSTTPLHNHAKVLHNKEYQDAKKGLLQKKTTEESSEEYDVSKIAPAREIKMVQLSL